MTLISLFVMYSFAIFKTAVCMFFHKHLRRFLSVMPNSYFLLSDASYYKYIGHNTIYALKNDDFLDLEN